MMGESIYPDKGCLAFPRAANERDVNTGELAARLALTAADPLGVVTP